MYSVLSYCLKIVVSRKVSKLDNTDTESHMFSRATDSERKGESKMLLMKIVHIDPEKKPEVTKKRISAGIPKLFVLAII